MILWIVFFSLWFIKMNTLNSQQLDALIQNDAIKSITVDGTTGGFIVCVNGTIIEARRGHARVFKKLQTAAAYLKNKGVGSFKVDVSQWTLDQNSAL